MYRIQGNVLWIFVLIVFFTTIGTSSAEEWNYTFSSYLHGAGLTGDVTVQGHSTEVDASFSDIISNLELGFVGSFKADNGTWSFTSEAIYMGLGIANSRPAAEVDINQWLIEVNGGRHLNQNVELLFGGKFNRIDGTVEFKGPVGVKVENAQSWFDPFVGARFTVPFGDRTAAHLRGDIGGFGVGSDFSWTVTPSFTYKVTESFTIGVFYRWIKSDYENEDDQFRYDTIASGPGFGFGYQF